jgi:hypothetical protein
MVTNTLASIDALTDTQLAYLAGWIDSSGYLVWKPNDRRTSWGLQIEVHGLGAAQLCTLCGTSSVSRPRRWRLFGQKAERLLERCNPYLRVKTVPTHP